MKIKNILTIIATVAVLTACSNNTTPTSDNTGNESNDSKQLKIVTTIPPIYSLTAHLIENTDHELTNLLPSNTSVHTFNLTPGATKDLNEADLVVLNGLELELFLEGALEDLDASIVEASSDIKPLKNAVEEDHKDHEDEEHEDHDDEDHHEDEDHEDHDDEDHHEDEDHEDHDDEDHHEDEEHEDHDDEDHHDHHHGLYDPHAWLAPDNAIIMAGTIRDSLIDLDPENEAVYNQNYQQLQTRLSYLDDQIRSELSQLDISNYLVFHNAYQYFEKTYGIEASGYLEEFPGDEPSAQYLAELVEMIEEENVTVLFTEPQFSPKLARTLSEDYGLSLGELDPLGQQIDKDGYFTMMESNLDALRRTFGAQ